MATPLKKSRKFSKQIESFSVIIYFLFSIIATSVIGVEIASQPLLKLNKDVQIELYTPKNPTKAQILMNNDINSIIESNYNPNAPTRIFIHGYLTGRHFKTAMTEGKIVSHNFW